MTDYATELTNVPYSPRGWCVAQPHDLRETARPQSDLTALWLTSDAQDPQLPWQISLSSTSEMSILLVWLQNSFSFFFNCLLYDLIFCATQFTSIGITSEFGMYLNDITKICGRWRLSGPGILLHELRNDLKRRCLKEGTDQKKQTQMADKEAEEKQRTGGSLSLSRMGAKLAG